VNDDSLESNFRTFRPENSEISLRVVKQTHHRAFGTLPQKHVVNVGLSFVGIAAFLSCLEFKWNRDLCGGVFYSIDEFAFEKPISFSFKSKVLASVHRLAANNFCDYQVLFLVLIDFDLLFEENMIFNPEPNVIEGLFAVSPKVIKRCFDQVHIIQERIINFLDDFFEFG
jgi:hypothetical protein